MTSLALILLVYLFWAIVGRSLLAVFSPKIGVLKAWLLAPAIGLALMTVFLMVLNQAGLPIDRIASIFTIFIILLTCFTYWITRPIFPVKRILPFIGALFITLFVIAWPALKLHFNWISFVTDDYVNYCLAADRFKQFGFYRLPTVDELTGRDYTQYFWFMHVPALVRFGAEHQIAWLSKITGLRTLQVFMPMIVALSLVQMSSLSALVLHKGRYRKHATWAAILLAISPLFVFGVVYELIAQVGGGSFDVSLM